jgi:hypothetical protein
MKIRAIIPNQDDHASNWWRILRPFQMLSNVCKVDTDFYTHDQIGSPDLDFKGALVIIHRMIPSEPKKYIKNLYKLGAASVIYSMDDYTCNAEALESYLKASGGLTSLAIQNILERIPRQLETLELCNYVITSTDDLSDLVSECTNTPIRTLENALDERWYLDQLSTTPSYKGNSHTVYIGWAGGRRPEHDLESMARAWKRICDDPRYDHVRFVVAGWQPDIIDRHIDLERKVRLPWVNMVGWPKNMQVDIGCCPLEYSLFNRGKSPIKYYEYTLAGAAVVASPLVYSKALLDNVTGYIAKNEEDWYDSLRLLIEDVERRHILQETAQYEIHNYSSLEASILQWYDTFQGCM